MRRLIGALNFYGRFAPSFTRPALMVRETLWSELPRLDGQTWLVTGASDGIGKAMCTLALNLGANVIGVARNQQALNAIGQSAEDASRFQSCIHDLSSMAEISRLVGDLVSSGERVDVLVNNVGVLLNEAATTDEGLEMSFATNLLGHYALTTRMRDTDLLTANARIINMSSGGMYNVPLLIEHLNSIEPYDGVMAYALHKRAQVVLNDYWQETDTERSYYVMHPGWVDTKGVATSLPTFHKMLRHVLRSPAEGADTAVWLGATSPDQAKPGIWFDRKLRDAHIYKFTSIRSASGAELDSFLSSQLEELSDKHSAGQKTVSGQAG